MSIQYAQLELNTGSTGTMNRNLHVLNNDHKSTIWTSAASSNKKLCSISLMGVANLVEHVLAPSHISPAEVSQPAGPHVGGTSVTWRDSTSASVSVSVCCKNSGAGSCWGSMCVTGQSLCSFTLISSQTCERTGSCLPFINHNTIYGGWVCFLQDWKVRCSSFVCYSCGTNASRHWGWREQLQQFHGSALCATFPT